ncbi:MAG: hypothetical protein RLZZ272_1271 [Actinomycetota bacterium]|jgi:DMSO/TMAO reductase YedYZ heme-binding membrane subunit
MDGTVAMLPDHLTWYVARSTGVVAWVALTASVCVGLALSTRALGPNPKPAWLTDLHRGVSASALVVTAVHLVALYFDEYVAFGLTELLLPMASEWKPLAVALGVVSMWLMVLVEATSLARRRISTRVWRAIHLLAFPAWVLATAHFLMAGTDVGRPSMGVLVVLGLVVVGGFVVVRLLVPRGRAAAAGSPRAARAIRSRSERAVPPTEDPSGGPDAAGGAAEAQAPGPMGPASVGRRASEPS